MELVLGLVGGGIGGVLGALAVYTYFKPRSRASTLPNYTDRETLLSDCVNSVQLACRQHDKLLSKMAYCFLEARDGGRELILTKVRGIIHAYVTVRWHGDIVSVAVPEKLTRKMPLWDAKDGVDAYHNDYYYDLEGNTWCIPADLMRMYEK
jgi:hypothetical protein